MTLKHFRTQNNRLIKEAEIYLFYLISFAK